MRLRRDALVSLHDDCALIFNPATWETHLVNADALALLDIAPPDHADMATPDLTEAAVRAEFLERLAEMDLLEALALPQASSC